MDCPVPVMGAFLYEEICQYVISIVGDYALPLPEVIYLLESILKHRMIELIDLAETIADMRASPLIELDDFIFLFRHDLVSRVAFKFYLKFSELIITCFYCLLKVMLRRLLDFVSFEKSIKKIESELENVDEHVQINQISITKCFFFKLVYLLLLNYCIYVCQRRRQTKSNQAKRTTSKTCSNRWTFAMACC